MPLHRGTSERVVSGNIREMRAAGHTEAQAVAAAERMKDKSAHRRFGDMNLAGGHTMAADKWMDSKKKKIPALAVSFGMRAPDDSDNPDKESEEDVDDEGADDSEEMMQSAGDAAIAALHAGDGLSFMKALIAGMKGCGMGGGDMEAADMDMGDGNEPTNPYAAGEG